MGFFRYNKIYVPPSVFDETKRSSINVDGPNTFSYAFIDHMKQADGFCGPNGSYYYTDTSPTWTQSVDAQGWPNSFPAGANFGGGPRIPASSSFGGPYVLTWTGDGTVGFVGFGQVWTANTTSSAGDTTNTYTRGGDSFTNKPGQTARVILNVSNNPGPALLNVYCSASGPTNFVKNIQFYRLEDEADLLLGNVFRRPYKQFYLDYNGHHVRTLDWCNPNDSTVVRFEHRNLPSHASWFQNVGASGQPKYGKTSMAVSNQFTLAAVTGTPVSMQHGEIATFRTDQSPVRATGPITVTGITQVNGGTNTVTAPSHGFANGDTIIIQMHDDIPGRVPSGMVQLHEVPRVISGVTTDTFTIPVNTFTYGAFITGRAYQYITLQVGTGSDRVAYPVIFYDGYSKLGRFPYLWAPGYPYGLKCAVFHKTVTASTTVTGAWLIPSSNFIGEVGLPLEVVVKLANELQAMSPRNTIHLWAHLPTIGMIASGTQDPDYSAASNWPVNMVDVIMNPSSTVRAAGWSELNSACTLYIEHANETWNFPVTAYLQAKLGYQQWPASGTHLGKYSTVRSVQSMKEVKAAFPSHPRIKYVMGMFTALGPGDGRNDLRINGDSDQFAALGSSNKMLSYFDYMCIAGYFSNNESTPANNLTTATAAFVAAGANNTAVEAACAAYAVGYAQVAKGGSETIEQYTTLLGQYASAAAAQGKRVIGYEGGWENSLPSYDAIAHARAVATFTNGSTSVTAVSSWGGSGVGGLITIPTTNYIYGQSVPKFTTVSASASGTMTLSAPATVSGTFMFTYMPVRDAFLIAFKQSQAWADTYMTWINAWNSITNADAPPEFIYTQVSSDRWSHNLEDSYLGTTEYGASDKAWLALKARNNL